MSKKIFRAFPVCLLVGALLFFTSTSWSPVSAEDSENLTFQLNVQEVLSVSVTTPGTWASGDVGDFLRNKVTLQVMSNNIEGFTASMIAESDTALHHSSKTGATLPTLTANTARSAFPVNCWGYSLDDTTAGNPDSNYDPMVGGNSTPISLISRTTSLAASSNTVSKDIYFGAKANMSQASGTYTGAVILYVVSGASSEDNNNPVVPSNPAQPSDDVATDNNPTYDSSNNRTIYTTTSDNTQTTIINEGDATDAYAQAQGVTDTTSSNIYDGSMLTTGLAVTASVAAASGIFFFVLAKRKKDDDEEETE